MLFKDKDNDLLKFSVRRSKEQKLNMDPLRAPYLITGVKLALALLPYASA